MFEDMPRGAWYVLAVGVVICLALLSFSIYSVEQQKADALDDACMGCAKRLIACAEIVNSFPGPSTTFDLNEIEGVT